MKGYLIGETLAQQIKSTIATVDALSASSDADATQTRFEERPNYIRKVFRACTFTGSWPINAEKTVTFRGVTTTPNTVRVTNLMCGLSPEGQCDVMIAKEGTAWYLVQPNLTQQPGYSSGGTQVLSVVNGVLRWVGTTACS
jgi:hypothetical protein